MTTTHHVTRVHGQFLPALTTPLAPSGNNTQTASDGGISKSYSTLRLRTDIELYVIAGGGTSGVDLSFAFETIIAVGGQLTQGGLATSSRTPLTDENFTPGTFELGDWVQWDYLYPDIQFVNTLVPQTVVVTWRPRTGVIDTQARRRYDSINGIDLWMPWEVQNGSGLIGTTDAHGNTYELGARFAQAIFWSGRT
jgi:hypothetical protein